MTPSQAPHPFLRTECADVCLPLSSPILTKHIPPCCHSFPIASLLLPSRHQTSPMLPCRHNMCPHAAPPSRYVPPCRPRFAMHTTTCPWLHNSPGRPGVQFCSPPPTSALASLINTALSTASLYPHHVTTGMACKAETKFSPVCPARPFCIDRHLL